MRILVATEKPEILCRRNLATHLSARAFVQE